MKIKGCATSADLGCIFGTPAALCHTLGSPGAGDLPLGLSLSLGSGGRRGAVERSREERREEWGENELNRPFAHFAHSPSSRLHILLLPAVAAGGFVAGERRVSCTVALNAAPLSLPAALPDQNPLYTHRPCCLAQKRQFAAEM